MVLVVIGIGLLVAVVAVPWGDDAPAAKAPTVYHQGDSIDVAVGEEFVVALPATPSTGYAWTAAGNPDVTFVSTRQVAGGSQPGAEGTQEMTFTGRQAGESTARCSRTPARSRRRSAGQDREVPADGHEVALQQPGRSTTHSGRTSALARPRAGPNIASGAGRSTSTTTAALAPAQSHETSRASLLAAVRSAAAGPRRTPTEREPVGGGERGGVGRRLGPGATDQRASEPGRARGQHETEHEHRQHQDAHAASLASASCSAARSLLHPHDRRGVEVGIGEQHADQREIGDRRVVDGDADLATDLRSVAHLDVGARQRAVRGADGASGIGIDARGPRRLARRVHHAELVAHHQPDLHHREQRQHHERQHERELDRGLAAFARRARRGGAGFPRAGRGGTSDARSRREDLLDHGVEQLRDRVAARGPGDQQRRDRDRAEDHQRVLRRRLTGLARGERRRTAPASAPGTELTLHNLLVEPTGEATGKRSDAATRSEPAEAGARARAPP